MSAAIAASPRACVRMAFPVSLAISRASSSADLGQLVADPREQEPAFTSGPPSPLRERRRCRSHGPVDILGAVPRDRPDHFPS